MPGPAPTPTAILAQRGSWRAKIRDEEPQYETVQGLTAPDGLSDRAEEVWYAVAPRLIGAGVLTVADVPALVRYVRMYAAWEKVMEKVEDDPTRDNTLSLAKIDDILRRLEGKFGLTPSDRTGIKTEKPAREGKSRFFGKEVA